MANVPNPMPCPCCGGKLTLGKADIHSSGLGFLFFGNGWHHLYFKPRREGPQAPRTKEIKILDYTQTPPAFLCSQCGAFLLPPDSVSETSKPGDRH